MHLSKFKVTCVSLFVFLSSVVLAADVDDEETSELEVQGSIEAGLDFGWPYGNPPASRFMVPGAYLNLTKHVYEKVKVVGNFAGAISSPVIHPDFVVYDSSKYWGNLLLTSGGMTAAIRRLYVSYDLTENIDAGIGYFDLPFGMEFMESRYDMHSYYYSSVIMQAASLGWMYDLGVWIKFTDVIPGTLEIALADGRQPPGGRSIPTGIARWHWDIPLEEKMSVTPVVSVNLRDLPPGPDPVNNWGVTAGVKWQAGNFWANAEYLRGTQDVTGPRTTFTSVIIEPGFIFGDFQASLKLDLASFKTEPAATLYDQNLALVLSSEFDNFRIRVTCMLANLSKQIAADQVTDLRLLFGTSW